MPTQPVGLQQSATTRVNVLGTPLCIHEFDDGTLCRQPAKGGTQYCRHHLDELAPLSTARYTEGRYLRSVPRRYLPDFKRARQDNDLLQLEDNIALYEARLLYLLRQAENGDTEEAWGAARGAYSAYKASLSSDEYTEEDRDDLLRELGRYLDGHVNTRPVWDEIRAMTMEKMKLAESERKRRLDVTQHIPLTDANARIEHYWEIVQQFVTDRGVLATIASQVRQELEIGLEASSKGGGGSKGMGKCGTKAVTEV